MRKCKKCICRKCVNNCRCGQCKNRDGPILSCANYNKYEQMSMFEKKKKKHPRNTSFEEYGLTEKQVEGLKRFCEEKRNEEIIRAAAYKAAPDIAEYIIASVEEGKSYDRMRLEWELGKRERMAYGKTDFYGYQRLFFFVLEKEIKSGTTALDK